MGSREQDAEETWTRVSPYLRRAGITRVADITGLDVVGIPVFNAVRPRSADGLSVYSGKGASAVAARTSAVMEAIERFAASAPLRVDRVASYRELVGAGQAVIAPRSHSLRLSARYHDDAPIPWVAGHDLLNDEPVLVPHGAAAFVGSHVEPSCYTLTTSNGLAAGRTMEQAAGHALCELIERDAVTVCEIESVHLGAEFPRARDALRSRHPHLDVASLPSRADALAARFRAAEISLRMVDITTDLGVPSILCTALDDFGLAAGQQSHVGFGTHPDAEIALVRALTECAQSRAIDIQAVREDLSAPGDSVPAFLSHTQRSISFDRAGWAWQPTDVVIAASELASVRNADDAADLRFVLSQLRRCGLSRAIIVDLSPPDLPVVVVRAIVPGLESWGLDRSRLGRRAAAAWNDARDRLRAA